tara:strand:+ start:7232 stop:8200 length:969 start_codon:yes stop_codon:yes gene_type:complete
MKKNIIAVVGLGYWGTIVVNTIVSMNIFKKIYIYDIDKKKVNILKKKFKDKLVFAKFKDIQHNNQIKNIFLATPPRNNFSILKKLIKNNKNILIEKPGMVHLNEFKKIKKILKYQKTKLSFGYIYLYNNYIRFLKKIIRSKKLGNVKYIKFERQNFGPIRNQVSAAYDLATHDLSILHYLLEKKIVLKNSINHDILGKKNFDISSLNLLSGNIKIDINVSWLNPEKIRKIIIIGSKKMLLYDEMSEKEPIKIYNNYVSFPKIDKFSKYYFNQSKYVFKGSSKSIKLKNTKPLNNEIKEFINNSKNITDITFSEKIIKILKNL